MLEIGPQIKALVEYRRVNKSELAKRLEMSEQNLYKIFKKTSLDVHLLEQFALELNVPITFFFRGFQSLMQNSGGQANTTEPSLEAESASVYMPLIPRLSDGAIRVDSSTQLILLRQEIEHLREIILLKDELIATLKQR